MVNIKIQSKKEAQLYLNKYNILAEEDGDNGNKDNVKELLERSIKNEINIRINIFHTSFSYL